MDFEIFTIVPAWVVVQPRPSLNCTYCLLLEVGSIVCWGIMFSQYHPARILSLLGIMFSQYHPARVLGLLSPILKCLLNRQKTYQGPVSSTNYVKSRN
jgi:hypothetical protein